MKIISFDLCKTHGAYITQLQFENMFLQEDNDKGGV